MMKRNITYIILVAGLIWSLTACALSINKGNGDAAIAWGCCAAIECAVILLTGSVFSLQDSLDIETKYSKEIAAIRDEAMKLSTDSLNNVDKMIKMNEELLADNRDLFTIIESMQEYVTEEGYEEINAKLSGTKHVFSKSIDTGKYELYTWVK